MGICYGKSNKQNYDSVNLDKNVRSYLTKTLKSYGYVEHESDIAGMKYKFNMNFIEDIEKIAKEVLELHIKKRQEYQKKYYDETRGIPKKKEKIEKVVSSQIIDKPIPVIGDLLYVIYDNHIYESKITKIELTDEDEMIFSVRIYTVENEEPVYKTLVPLKRSNLFASPEDAANYLVLKRIQYKNK